MFGLNKLIDCLTNAISLANNDESSKLQKELKTNVEIIEECAFYNCPNLTKIENKSVPFDIYGLPPYKSSLSPNGN